MRSLPRMSKQFKAAFIDVSDFVPPKGWLVASRGRWSTTKASTARCCSGFFSALVLFSQLPLTAYCFNGSYYYYYDYYYYYYY